MSHSQFNILHVHGNSSTMALELLIGKKKKFQIGLLTRIIQEVDTLLCISYYILFLNLVILKR